MSINECCGTTRTFGWKQNGVQSNLLYEQGLNRQKRAGRCDLGCQARHLKV